MYSTGKMSIYTPVNERPREIATIDSDVDYAMTLGQFYLAQIHRFGLDPGQVSVLELGPGINFGPQLILASYGARVAVADAYLAAWSDDYHPEFYRRLRERWTGEGCALDRVVAANAHDASVISTVPQPAEDLAGIETGSIDCVFSNAVLEHVYDLPKVCRELARVTRVGGVNSHQIDFRHHLNFARPLEFLLESERTFRADFLKACGEQGNRWRQSEAEALFELAGFEVTDTVPTHWAEDDYLENFLPRLRGGSSRYRTWPADELKVVSARLELRRIKSAAGRLRGAARFYRGEMRKIGAGGLRNLPFDASWSGVSARVKERFRRRYQGELCDPRPESGHCWMAAVPSEISSDSGGTSRLEVFEDGRRLGPAHAPHADIRRYGEGRYSHWGAAIYFSTSDNSDPRANGRRYTFLEKSP